MPAGCIFGHKGPAAFIEGDNSNDLLALLAITTSLPFCFLVELQIAFGSYEVGAIQRTPVPNLNPTDRDTLAKLARRAWSLKRSLDTRTETSHAFTLPALLQVQGPDLQTRASNYKKRVQAIENELQAIQEQINTKCFELYGIDETDRRAISEGFGKNSAEDESEEEEEESEANSGDALGSPKNLGEELVSWAIGAAFGRFDIDLATGKRQTPKEPDPFEALPARAPASPPNQEHALAEAVDDPGHPKDLTAAVRTVFEKTFGLEADAYWNQISALLDPKDHELRAWISNAFFDFHLKRYSKSRRKAPVLWQLCTASGRFSLWLYAHRLNRDSFFQLQNDIVSPKLIHEERRLNQAIESAGQSPSNSERKQIENQRAVVEELRAMLDEIKRIAPLWNPNLDDGVIINFAPLYRLVPQHKAWQKELKSTWDALCAGKYDWAHWAMHLWPERVLPKCKEDRSLAIAHGLEEVFWEEGKDGKWKARATPLKTVEALLKERHSPAVKAALSSLMDMPQAAPTPKRARKAKANES